MDIGYNGYAMLIDNSGKVLVRPGMDRTDTRWDKTYATEDLRHTDNPAFNTIIDHMVQGTNMLENYEAGGRKNLKGATKVEDFNIIEKNDAYMLSSHTISPNLQEPNGRFQGLQAISGSSARWVRRGLCRKTRAAATRSQPCQ